MALPLLLWIIIVAVFIVLLLNIFLHSFRYIMYVAAFLLVLFFFFGISFLDMLDWLQQVLLMVL